MQFHAQDVSTAELPVQYDVVICHTLLEYTPDVEETVRKLTAFLKPDGILSLVFVNRHADVLKQVFNKGDFTAAAAALYAHQADADLFGVPRQTFDSEYMHRILQSAGLRVQAEYGVRIFADYLDAWQDEALISLEIAAAQRPPFQQMGRYGQMISTH
jgi:S-adenosylmethionine-dependent methyltransferase